MRDSKRDTDVYNSLLGHIFGIISKDYGAKGKILPANVGDARDTGSIPGSGRSPGEENGNPLPYSCLENSMDREAWQATVHRVAQSQTWLK